MKKIIGTMLMLWMMLVTMLTCFAEENSQDEEMVLEDFFNKPINEIEIERKYLIKDFNENVQGYYYDTTDGYVIIRNNYVIQEYSKYDSYCFINEAVDVIDDNYDYLNSVNIYITDWYSYYIRVNNDKYIYSISTSLIEKIDFDEMKKNVESTGSAYTSGLIEQSPVKYESGYYSRTVKNVPCYASVSYFTTSDFAGYSNHCAPTAATNLMKYWYIRNNSKYDVLLSSSWRNTFEEMYSRMGTSSENGTYTNRLASAYHTYMVYKCGLSMQAEGLIKSPTDTKMRAEIDAGYPFHLCVYGHNTYGNHSVVAIGYESFFYRTTYVTRFYLRIVDGWSNSIDRYIYMSDSNITKDMVVIRPN